MDQGENIVDSLAHRTPQNLVLAVQHAVLKQVSKSLELEDGLRLFDIGCHHLLNEVEEHVQNLGLVPERLHEGKELLLVIRVSIVVLISLLLLVGFVSRSHELLTLLSLLGSLDLLLNLLD